MATGSHKTASKKSTATKRAGNASALANSRANVRADSVANSVATSSAKSRTLKPAKPTAAKPIPGEVKLSRGRSSGQGREVGACARPVAARAGADRVPQRPRSQQQPSVVCLEQACLRRAARRVRSAGRRCCQTHDQVRSRRRTYRSEEGDVPHLPRHAFFEGPHAVQDAFQRGAERSRQARTRTRLLFPHRLPRHVARRWRHLPSRASDACAHPPIISSPSPLR